jgi:hypothetical protein
MWQQPPSSWHPGRSACTMSLSWSPCPRPAAWQTLSQRHLFSQPIRRRHVERTKQDMLMKVPEITLIFWIAKLSTTAFGVAFSDYIFFNDYIGRNPAILMGRLPDRMPDHPAQGQEVRSVGLLARGDGGKYLRDDVGGLPEQNLGMPLYASTLLLLGLQAAVFIAWYVTEKTPGCSEHLHSPPGTVLLAERSLNLWPRNCRGRFFRRHTGPGHVGIHLRLPRGHSRSGGWLQMAQARRSPCIPVCLHHYPSPRRLLRGLAGGPRSLWGRASAWDGAHQPGSGDSAGRSHCPDRMPVPARERAGG